MRVGLVGPGRLGRTLARLLAARGVHVDLRGRGEGLPEQVDGLLITVPDSAVSEVARAWAEARPAGVPVLHTSGSLGVEVLRPARPAGSLHPLMSFPGPEIAIPDPGRTPAAIAGDPEAVRFAHAVAERLGWQLFEVPGDRRLYHAAAVIAGNFATVLLAEAARVLAAAGVADDEAAARLVPLAVASLEQAAHDPAAALTGPVARGDEAVIAGHRAALAEANLTAPLEIYDLLTQRARALKAGRT